jgi:DNA-binding NarL/FixJ family response regulator
VLGEHVFVAAWDAGRTLSPEQATAEALRVAGQIGAGTTSMTALPTPREDIDEALSRREREVLRLLADGRSDGEIGAELFITRRTASKHVAAILDKLSVSNRTAAVALAVRHGII